MLLMFSCSNLTISIEFHAPTSRLVPKYYHERLADFNEECENGERVFYFYAEIDGRSLDKVENALIVMLHLH